MSNDVLIQVTDLSVTYHISDGLFKQTKLHAVNHVSMEIKEGAIVGLVGESGSGKSTFGRAILKLAPISGGYVQFDGMDIRKATKSDVHTLRQQTAMIFQDPFSSLNPKQTIGGAIREVLKVHRKQPVDRIEARIDELLSLTGLSPDHKSHYPGQLSGGQCQRAVIARALAMEPRLVVADECVAALDVSIQAQIINLLLELNRKMNLTILFIAHDLAIVRKLCDRVAVMYLGKIVEEGTTEAVFEQPLHPYTKALISAIPDINPENQLPKNPLNGEPPSPIALPKGCVFQTRCSYVTDKCQKEEPPLLTSGDHHYACVYSDSSHLSFNSKMR